MILKRNLRSWIVALITAYYLDIFFYPKVNLFEEDSIRLNLSSELETYTDW